jgi:hypothetical protein
MRITDENKAFLMQDFVAKMMALVETQLDSIDNLGPGRRENFKKALSKELVKPITLTPTEPIPPKPEPPVIVTPPTSPSDTHIPADVVAQLESIGYDGYMADTILSLISLPENSTTSWWTNYNFAKCLGDGRGWTVTLFGACSGTGDLLMILGELQKINPGHKLCKYIHPMKKTIGDDITGLENLGKDIVYMGDDEDWQCAVWKVYIKLYWNFANDFSSKTGSCDKRPGPKLTMPVTRGFMVDVSINHGPDLMSLTPIIRKMKNKSEPDELRWCLDFLEARRQLLKAGYKHLDSSGIGGRCILWSDIIKSGNVNLKRPITCHPGYWGRYKTIK